MNDDDEHDSNSERKFYQMTKFKTLKASVCRRSNKINPSVTAVENFSSSSLSSSLSCSNNSIDKGDKQQQRLSAAITSASSSSAASTSSSASLSPLEKQLSVSKGSGGVLNQLYGSHVAATFQSSSSSSSSGSTYSTQKKNGQTQGSLARQQVARTKSSLDGESSSDGFGHKIDIGVQKSVSSFASLLSGQQPSQYRATGDRVHPVADTNLRMNRFSNKKGRLQFILLN